MEITGTPLITTTQLITLGGCILCFITLTIWSLQNKKEWLYIVPIFIFVLNAFLFYVHLLLDNLTNGILDRDFLFYTEWSSYIRLQALATVLLYCYMFTNWKSIISWIRNQWHKNSGQR